MTPDPDVTLTIDHRLPYPEAKALLEGWRAHTQTQMTGDEFHDAGCRRVIQNIEGALDLLAARHANRAPATPDKE